MRDCKFWAAAAFSVGGLVVMAIMGKDGADDVHTADVVRAGILAAVVLATWIVVHGQREAAKRTDRLIQRLDEIEKARTDDELLVARTIRATLHATGHDLDRPDAKLYRIQP